jgi:LmbE family N-acetylglucosaminyl deacetylase
VPLKLLAIFPHPDDETLGLGPTLARYADDPEVETYLVCATRGERGWQGEPAANPGLQALGQMREAELRAAAQTLGVQEVTVLDYIDGDVDQAEPGGIITQLAHHIRRLQPHIVITFPPDGNYGHPDHIALSQFTTAALVCAADPGFIDPVQQSPHRVAKFYFMADSRELVDAMAEQGFVLKMPVDGVERGQVAWEAWQLTTQVEAAEQWPTVLQAIRCHQSQLPSLGDVLNLPEETLRRVWGRNTFYRAYSLVNGGRHLETDLFEGLR